MNKVQPFACPQGICSLLKERDFSKCWADQFISCSDSEYYNCVARVALRPAVKDQNTQMQGLGLEKVV